MVTVYPPPVPLYTHTHMCTHMHTHMHTHTLIHMCTHTYMHTLTHAHTDTDQPLLNSGIAIEASPHNASHPVSAAILNFGVKPLFWEPGECNGNAWMRINLASNHVITALEIRGECSLFVWVWYLSSSTLMQEMRPMISMPGNSRSYIRKYCSQKTLSMGRMYYNSQPMSLHRK